MKFRNFCINQCADVPFFGVMTIGHQVITNGQQWHIEKWHIYLSKTFLRETLSTTQKHSQKHARTRATH